MKIPLITALGLLFSSSLHAQNWTGKTTITTGVAFGSFSQTEHIYVRTERETEYWFWSAVDFTVAYYWYEPVAYTYGLTSFGLQRIFSNGPNKRHIIGSNVQMGARIHNPSLRKVSSAGVTATSTVDASAGHMVVANGWWHYRGKGVGVGFGLNFETPSLDLWVREVRTAFFGAYDPKRKGWAVTLSPEFQLGLMDILFLDVSINQNSLLHPLFSLGLGTGLGNIDRYGLGISIDAVPGGSGFHGDVKVPLSERVSLEGSVSVASSEQLYGEGGTVLDRDGDGWSIHSSVAVPEELRAPLWQGGAKLQIALD